MYTNYEEEGYNVGGGRGIGDSCWDMGAKEVEVEITSWPSFFFRLGIFFLLFLVQSCFMITIQKHRHNFVLPKCTHSVPIDRWMPSHRQCRVRRRGPLGFPPRRPNPADAAFLILTQPRLAGLAQHPFPHKVHHQPPDDADERERIHPVHPEAKHPDPDHDAPEIARQQADVEEGRRRHTEQDRGDRVEERQAKREPDEVAAHRSVPGRRAE